MSVVLTQDEIHSLTGYKRPGDQLRELKRQGFYRARQNKVTGEVILERPHYEAICGTDKRAANDSDGPQLRRVRK